MKVPRIMLPLAALIGTGIAVFAVMRGDRSAQPATTSTPTSQAGQPQTATAVPFAAYVAGTGMVEAGTGNIAVGTPVSGIVAEVFVTWGQTVHAGDPLLRIDDRDLRAALPLAAARVQEAAARLAKARYQAGLADKLRAQHVLSEEQFQDRKFEVQIDEAALAAARATVEQTNLEIGRRVVRASVAGRVLQINARPGEFAESGVLPTPLMVIGDDAKLRVRVDIDEHDVERVTPGAPAVAAVRGKGQLMTALHFESIEPYVAPKKSLTGDVTERVDTRVLQVIYTFDRAALPVYVGQQLDFYISAPPPVR